MNYNRDYRKISLQLLPLDLRKDALNTLVQVLNSQLQPVHLDLIRLVADAYYKIQHTGQVCYLQSACNDAVDDAERRILIKDTNISSALVPLMYDNQFEREILLGEITLNDNQLYNSGDYDFQVIVPFDIDDISLVRLKATLNFYKLAGKRYIITNTEIV